LRVPQRVQYKIAVLVYKSCTDSTMSLTCLVADLSVLLVVPPVKLATVANQPGFPG